jgi:hypothetical protein
VRPMTKSMHRVEVSLDLPTRVPDLAGYAKRVVLCMTDNPWFSSPIPSIADVASAVDELESAQVATLTRTRGTAEVRDEKLKVVNGLLKRLKAYVQGVADDNPEQAGSIIESSGMNIKNKGSYAKPPFKVKPGKVKGTVRLEVRSAGDRASYEWAWSTDGGKTWQTRQTTQASVDIDGLPSGMLCLFRCQVTTPKGGSGNWSETVELMVP